VSSPLANFEPRLVWQHFDSIRQIPHPSGHEQKLGEHIASWGSSRGFAVRRDSAGNVVIGVPATPGHEAAPIIILQGHLDMVPEKNSDVSFDFLRDPIQVRVVEDYVYATGTTLGADNGVGVAAAMAVAEDPDAVHGPLELLFTVEEETGLTGAIQLDAGLLAGRTLLNLDTEEDAALYIGCAGGADARMTFTVTREDALPDTIAVAVSVRGLRGGHSGVDIHENRGNALKLVARTLNAARRTGVKLALVSIAGGSKHNAIPREADAVLRIPREEESVIRQVIDSCSAMFKEELGEIEPKLRLELGVLADDVANSQVWLPFDTDRVLGAMLACPHGVLAMSRAVPGLVETSSNLAVVAAEGNEVRFVTSSRSSVMPSLRATIEQVSSLFRLAGATVEEHDGYPGWKPNPSSPVLQRAMAVFERHFGKKPMVKAIHAGLECGLIGEKFPGMDMVSMGPQIESPHSPDERVQISTVDRFYTLLKATLADLA
jgi:dipeptidase D